MFKSKLNDFKVSIRRQQKDKIFADIRKEQQQITRIQDLLGKIFNLDLRKQNFEVFWECFKEVNTYLIEFSKIGSKGSILDVGKIIQEGKDIPFNPLQGLSKKYCQLTSQQFKRLVLDLFEVVYKVKKYKINSQLFQISDKLLSELTLMTGILFKEPESCAMLFPFNSIKEYTQNQKQSSQDIFESSFELFEHNISYLKQKFETLENQPEVCLINFLTIVHSIGITLQFFVVNIEQTKKKTLKNSKSNPDDQKILYFFNLLKSHNFENYLQEVLEELINNQNHDQAHNCLDEIPIFLSLLSLINMYCKFIQLGRFSIQTQFYSSRVKKFHNLILKWYSSLNSNTNNKTTSVDLRILFELHSLAYQSVLCFNEKDVIPLCYEMIKYLLFSAQKVQHEKNTYKKPQQTQPKTVLSQFYFKVLVAEQGERWIHFLQILTSLQQLVREFDISLDDFMNYTIKENDQFNEEIILKLFEDMSYCITNISGYFHNEIHLFAQSLVILFVIWKNNSFLKGYPMWNCEFWMKISQCLYKLIDEIQFSTMGNEEFDMINYDQRENNHRENQNDVQIDTDHKSKNTRSTIVLLQELRKLVDLTVEQTKNQSLDPTIEIII